ncbi:15585_t:CDS:1, partial [Gigaspora margarita]
WDNSFHLVSPANVVIRSDVTDPQSCCKTCLANQSCLQWFFINQCIIYFDLPDGPSLCANATRTIVNSGNIRCGVTSVDGICSNHLFQ